MCISNKDRPGITVQPSCLKRKLDQKNIYVKYIFKLPKISEGINWYNHFGKLFASNYIYIYIFIHIFLLLNNSIPRNISKRREYICCSRIMPLPNRRQNPFFYFFKPG